jgi:hypothetical protein
MKQKLLRLIKKYDGEDLANAIIDLFAEPKKRTRSQNNALHLYLTQVAEELDRNGHTLQDVVKAITKVEIRPTMLNIKDVVWREIQKSQLGIESTTELKKQEDIDKVYDVMNKWLGTYFEIHIPFPVDEQKQFEKVSHGTYKE